ncbi:MAG: Ig-like domain repeat protein [Theionarchaea archaeon]|nr:Ig-like domain repeat protein [Theionarchaea archaeon]
MAIEFRRAGKGVGLFLMLMLAFLVSTVDFSLCQIPCGQYQARIWVDRGCGSSYSEGDPITVYYKVEERSISCEGGTGSPPQADASMSHVITNPNPNPTVTITIIDYYVTQGTSTYVVQNQSCNLNQEYSLPGTVDYVAGERELQLHVEIETGAEIIHLLSSCHFYVTSSRRQCSLDIWSSACNSSLKRGDGFTVSFSVSCEPATYFYLTVINHTPQGSQEVISNEHYLTNIQYTKDFVVSDQAQEGMRCLEFTAFVPETEQTLQEQCCFHVISDSPCYDQDNDGYTTCNGDCNDYDPAIHPGAEDICDGIDNNCNGTTDENCRALTINLGVSPPSLTKGEIVSIYGGVSQAGIEYITLTFTRPDGTTFTQTVIVDIEGYFSYSFEPYSSGTWYVSASVEGSSRYRGASSNPVSFTVIAETHISLQVTPTDADVEENIVISGSITPALVLDVKITIEDEMGHKEERIVTTLSDGTFSLIYSPDRPGTWYVTASVGGTSEYAASTSERISFFVKKIETSISLHITSTLVYPGEEIEVSGNITPPMSVDITITFESEEGDNYTEKTTTSDNGTFSISYKPGEVGIWLVSASFTGNQNYESSRSNTATFTVTREKSAVSLSLSKNKVVEYDSIEITGEIRPPRSTTVLIYLENSSGENLSFQVLSKEDGTFSYVLVPESAGVWSAYAQVLEEPKYTGATSVPISFTVEPAVPDLAVSNLVVDPLSVEPGENVKIHFEVENLGTGAAEGITVLVSVNSGAERIIIYETQISGIEAGDWRSINVDWIAVSGVDTIAIEIDPLNSIPEVSEENNQATQQMDISFKRDISITGVYFSSEKIREGETVTITAKIHCEGEIPVCQIEFWDGERGKGSKIGTKMLIGLSGETSVKVLWTPSSGRHEIHVVADPLDRVPEFDEENNGLKNETTVEETPPIVETTLVVATATSAGIYWYLKDTARSLSRIGKRITRPFHNAGEPIRHASRVSRALQPARYPGGYPLSPAKDLLLKAGESIAASETAGKLFCAKGPLLKAAESTAATEIGAKLYKALYSRYYHWNKAQPVDFERAVQHKRDILEKVVTHLFVFEGYIDTEEFCRFFNVDELELLEILDFLYKNGYIERVVA